MRWPPRTDSCSNDGVHVLSVNVGVARDNPWKPVGVTGIDKRPVDGPVLVTAAAPKGAGDVGLAGDHAYDIGHHGGADQAVYAYAREDLDVFSEELGRPLRPGQDFGENLTTQGVDVNGALIGERWRIGSDLVLEVSCPRTPCSTFQGWIGVPGWNRRFLEAGRPGAYLRVVSPGLAEAGDRVTVVSRPDHDVTVALTFRALTLEPALLARLLPATALPAEGRALVARRLAGSS
jgi:MOSC domain-containing protein YiiM